jgi:hypothetical protein
LGCDKNLKRLGIKDEPWASGYRIEDVWIDLKEKYEEWEPHVQAFKNEEGALALRFCYYKRKPDGSRGRFVNSSMMVYDWTIEDLRQEAKKCKADVILMLFKKLAK